MVRTFLLAVMLVGLVACLQRRGGGTVEWDRSTLRLVAEGGVYGRVVVLKSGVWVAGFSRGSSVWASRSEDGGWTWSEAVKVAGYAKGHATNSELVELADGRVMYLYNEREGRHAREGEPDNGIGVSFSSDGGRTWGEGKRIYGGGPMWEPLGFVNGGEIWVVFADEKPFPRTDEQEIARMVSRDGGATWQGPERMCFRKGCRDGMPVVVRLSSGRVVMAIEDNGTHAPPAAAVRSPHGWFKPAVVELVGGKETRRWGALREALPDAVYAGAPYLVRVGERTVLSAQVHDPSVAAGEREMVVWVGTSEGREFGGASKPFEEVVDERAEQVWNALVAIKENRVLAVGGTSVGGKRGIWVVEGRVE